MRPVRYPAFPSLAGCLAALAAPAAAPAAAQNRGADQFSSLTDIDAQVAEFTGAQPGTLGGAKAPVDRRLRLVQCYSPLALSWHGTRRDTVRVECADAGGWRIFVATSGGSANAAQAARPVQQQTVIKRGEQVSVTVRGRGFSISRAGEAMEDGGMGDWIKVRPGDASDPVRGQVIRPGLVEIPVS